MFRNKFIGVVLLSISSFSAFAFSSVDEQIDHYLQILASPDYGAKGQMLERLQWSGLTGTRLYDVIESNVLSQYQNKDLSGNDRKIFAHQLRALGFSGNEKYRATLKLVLDATSRSSIKRYTEKALRDMTRYAPMIQLIAESEFEIEGKSAEVEVYMKMLNTDDPSVQKLAARAIYFEQQDDPDLLYLVVEKVRGMYVKSGLDGKALDTAAWLIKAIGKNGGKQYIKFITEVADETFYPKLKRVAEKFVP